MIVTILLAASATYSDPELVISAAREPVDISSTGGALAVVDEEIGALALPQLVDFLRLSPGVSISRSGPTGSQTQVRLRGAESNHTLVFVDGIEANDPASSGDFRWETLSADGIERVEVLRGPQSALWGSEAIGGVVAVTSRSPAAGTAAFANAEGGSFGTRRAAAGFNLGSQKAGVVVQSSWYDTDGIDSFAGGPAERDGYESAAVSIKASVRPSPVGEIGIVARYTSSLAEFDGLDPSTYLRADTEDAQRIRGLALRGYARVSAPGSRWRHDVFGTYLNTENINRIADEYQNRSNAETFRAGYQTSVDVSTGNLAHRLTVAAEYRSQQYRGDDDVYLGATRQRVSRARQSLVLDYGLSAGSLSLAASLRHDDNDSFADATTWRASTRLAIDQRWSVRASAGEGVADPTFTEQFGYFPDSFVGNPALSPERSFGWDAGIAYSDGWLTADLGWFETDLDDEIVDTFDSDTYLSGAANATGTSRRRGIEASFDARPANWLVVGGSYTWLDAEEAKVAGHVRVREVRRARHTANLMTTADLGKAKVSLAANYVGKRRDIDFDAYPARDVTLGDYVLATLSAQLRLGERLEVTGRVENLLDARYQDVFGYRTQGLSAFGGVRVRWGG